jgi:Ner family transcriptional regulator
MNASLRSNRSSAGASIESDMHPADIVAALRKRGWPLRKLSLYNGMHPKPLGAALHRSYPNVESLIALAIGVRPEKISPARKGPAPGGFDEGRAHA